MELFPKKQQNEGDEARPPSGPSTMARKTRAWSPFGPDGQMVSGGGSPEAKGEKVKHKSWLDAWPSSQLVVTSVVLFLNLG